MTKVLIYSTSSCPYCQKAKDFLNQHNIEFEDVNVQEDREKAQEMVQKSGQMGVPVLDIDGNVVVGFDQGKIQELLKI
mgnify:CR=1 FL=1